MQLAMIGEKIVPFEQLEPVYLDRAFYFGDGVYEVLRSYNGRIFALDEHLARFQRSLEAIRITGVETDYIRQKVIESFDAAQITNAKIYFHITRGSAIRSHTWPQDIPPNFFLTVTDLPDHTKEKSQGISVSTYPDLRWKRCDIKSLNLLPNILARQDAADKGCDEAILVDDEGLITEGAGSTLFAVFGNTLWTTPLTANILPSVTRKYVIKAAKNIGMEILERSFTPDSAKKADELLNAVTTRDIVGVIQFDDVPIKNGRPGCYTGKLTAEFRSFTK